MKRSLFLPYLQITGAMVIVGSNIVVAKLISDSLPVYIASTLRFALASVLLLLLVLRVEKRFPRIMKKDLFSVLLISFFGNFLYSIFLLYGLKLTSATESGIISGTSPVVTAVLSYVFLHERLGLRRIIGLCLVILGIVIINLSGGAASGTMHSVVGDLFIGGSVVGEALWTILGKTVSPRMSPLVIAALTTFSGFLFFLPFGIVQAVAFPMQLPSVGGWLEILYYGSVGTVGAYLLWYRAIPKVSASTAGMFVGIMPVSAVILSYVLLREPFLWAHALGVISVLMALVCITVEPGMRRIRSISPHRKPSSVEENGRPQLEEVLLANSHERGNEAR